MHGPVCVGVPQGLEVHSWRLNPCGSTAGGLLSVSTVLKQ